MVKDSKKQEKTKSGKVTIFGCHRGAQLWNTLHNMHVWQTS